MHRPRIVLSFLIVLLLLASVRAAADQILPLQDYLLFRGSVENVVAEGRFDHQWRLPEEAARRLRATGAAVVAGAR